MGLFNKVLASIGIGAAKVDTKLHESHLLLGESVTGVVEVTGGNIEQQIDDIYLSLCATYTKEVDDRKVTKQAIIEKWKIAQSFKIRAGEKKEFPFSFSLPLDTPITVGKTRVWLHTGLDIKNAVDPTDEDYIRVQPTRVMDAVFQVMENLGFRLKEAECKEAAYHVRKRLPFVQEFEFVPVSGEFRGKLDEVEIIFFPHALDECELLIQVDRRARGLAGLFAEALDLDETFIRVTIREQHMHTLQTDLASLIRRYA
ncbi:sporulation protein [Anoxybacillus sp. LAT_35]|uniref:sporulation protein n=1 Tax=Anoxybacillus TaxID=150247 RepID=UPI001ED9FB00|nr:MULTISPECIES: sporulation protein [Anoxybacillus]MCG5026861.1 sporulation protein [Anoxybacillus flavithermus]MCG6197033.1 sporulation protein [Anoxybacillus sp. LAT_38]MCG3083307.1 sporulation protein [Anoxybacillus sp. LAT27]MCG6171325.1 sporulation protein [Anoxybacillus sp. LAT_11]MCG6176431.1 sporulation protein [Anoxybacillus sp. LAT_31]